MTLKKMLLLSLILLLIGGGLTHLDAAKQKKYKSHDAILLMGVSFAEIIEPPLNIIKKMARISIQLLGLPYD